MDSKSLSECCVCGRYTKANNQIFCNVCQKPAHTWSFLTPDSFRCSNCGATVCREHARRIGNKKICLDCSTGSEKPLAKRWLMHFFIGLIFSIGTLVPLFISMFFQDFVLDVMPVLLENIELVTIGSLAVFFIVWWPFIFVSTKISFAKRRLLIYPKIH